MKKHQKGFTLVELLASIIVLVAVGSVVGGIMTSSLRGTNKTNVLETIRQNGNYTLSQISKNIEYAQVFDGLGNEDGNGAINYVTSCPSSAITPTPFPVTTNYQYIKVTPINSTPIVYNCNYPAFTANGVPLIDTSSVSLLSCSIACTQTKSSDVPVIKISFTLGPVNPNSLPENSTPPVLFETAITIRNYKR